jgi:hypothetical protein
MASMGSSKEPTVASPLGDNRNPNNTGLLSPSPKTTGTPVAATPNKKPTNVGPNSPFATTLNFGSPKKGGSRKQKKRRSSQRTKKSRRSSKKSRRSKVSRR